MSISIVSYSHGKRIHEILLADMAFAVPYLIPTPEAVCCRPLYNSNIFNANLEDCSSVSSASNCFKGLVQSDDGIALRCGPVLCMGF